MTANEYSCFPLDQSYLCINCDWVSNDPHLCPHCSSPYTVKLSNWIKALTDQSPDSLGFGILVHRDQDQDPNPNQDIQY